MQKNKNTNAGNELFTIVYKLFKFNRNIIDHLLLLWKDESLDDSLKPMYLFNNLIDHMDQRSF